MTSELLERLFCTDSQAERDWIILEVNLASLEPPLREAVWAGAVPHCFDQDFLNSLIDQPLANADFDRLTDLPFVENALDTCFSIHDRVRCQLLDHMWSNSRDLYLKLAHRACDYVERRGHGDTASQIEILYHLLIANSDEGLRRLKSLGTTWERAPQCDYETIEVMARVAAEHVSSDRLTGHTRAWVLFWQGHIQKLYGRYEDAERQLRKFAAYTSLDALLAVRRARDLGDVSFALGKYELARIYYQRAIGANSSAGNVLDEAEIRDCLNEAERKLVGYRFCQVSFREAAVVTQEEQRGVLQRLCHAFKISESDVRTIYSIPGVSAVVLELPTRVMHQLTTALATREPEKLELGIEDAIEVIFEPYHYRKIIDALSATFSLEELLEICRKDFTIVIQELTEAPFEVREKEEVIAPHRGLGTRAAD